MKEFIKKTLRHIKRVLVSYRVWPQRKQYLEFITALLSIPVLLTVIVLNINSLRNLNPQAKPATPTQPNIIVVTGTEKSPTGADNTGASVTPVSCTQAVNQVDITYPEEGDSISDNPLSIDISAPQAALCNVVWSYRVNGSNWSDYDNNSVSLYNLSSGSIRFDLRIKSLSSGQQRLITRNFIYKGTGNIPTPTNTPTPTFSPNNQSSSSAH